MVNVSNLGKSAAWPLIIKVKKVLDDSGIEAYLVGGWVRDLLLGRETDDIDFAVAADGLEVAATVAGALDGTFVPLDRINRIGRVVLTGGTDKTRSGYTLDFAGYNGTIESDLARRDFTIDSFAIHLRDMEHVAAPALIDPFHGLKDLEDRLIRTTSDNAFTADPVRLLRAWRLAAVLGFEIEADTRVMMQSDARLVSSVAGERVREELLALLGQAGSGRRLLDMDDMGILTAIFPELEVTRGQVQPKEHHWDVLRHSIMTAVALDYLLRHGSWEYAGKDALDMVPWTPELDEYFRQPVGYASTRGALFKLAAVLHDVAKPQTRTVEPSGKVRFLGHPQQGAEIATAALERLRFSTKETRLVDTAVKYHLRPTQMGWPELPTRRAIYRYCRDAGDAAAGVLFLSLADHMATRGPDLDLANWAVHCRTVAHVLSESERQPTSRPRLVDGYDIMSRFGLKPGPKVGKVLETVQEAYASGDVTSRDEAFELAKRILEKAAGEKGNP